MATAKTVTLLDKDGNEYRAAHPADITNLVYGAGYRFKDKDMTADKAAELLAEKGPAAVAAAEQQGTPPTPKP